MRVCTLVVVAYMAVVLPKVSKAQAYAFAGPMPEVSAAAAEWQLRSEPIIVNGIVYFPTRAFRLFDATVMTQTGVYEGVPVYSDVTLEPFSIVYVPVSPSNLRVYERRRDGALAGTTGSRTPSFPVEIASDTVRANAQRANAIALMANAGNSATAVTTESPTPDAIATSGVIRSTPTGAVGTAAGDRARTRIEVLPRPAAGAVNGVWLVFNGARWYAGGAAVPFTPDRFEPIGEYRGFPVYRDKTGARKNEIWVSVVKEGPVAPYTKR